MNAVSVIGVVTAFCLVFLWLLALCAEKGVHPLGRVRQGFRRLPGWEKALILIFVSVWIAFAGTKDGTNGVDQVEGDTNTVTQVEGGTDVLGGVQGRARIPAAPQREANGESNGQALWRSRSLRPTGMGPISDVDIVQLWRIGATVDGNAFAAPTANAVTNAAWCDYGGMSDSLRIRPEGWHFPYGNGTTTGLTVFENGEFRPNVKTHFFPTPFDANLSLLPRMNWGLLPNGGESVFWHEQTPSNSLVLTWHNALYNRDINCPTNFQAELFADGRFDYRYPDRTVQYAPVFPFDWDGDGLANEVDPEPRASNGVCFGQGEAWIRATFTNADEIVSAGYTNWVSGWVGCNAQNGRYRLSVRFAGGPQRPLRLKVGRFAVVVDAACELVFPLDVDEVHVLEMSCDCDGVEYVWDDGYTGDAESFDVEFIPPAGQSPGRELMTPRLVVVPGELAASEAMQGAQLTPYINRPSPSYEWRDRFDEASFETNPDGSTTVSGIGGGTEIYVDAVSGTNTAGQTVVVQNPAGASSAQPDGEPPRADAQLAPSSHEVPPPAGDVETAPVKWIGFPSAGTETGAGQLVQTNGTFTIPAGRTCFVGAFVSTAEYPVWTRRMVEEPFSTRYNDLYWWRVRVGREMSERTGSVRDLHVGLEEGHAADDLSPTVFSGGQFFTAETNSDLTVSFTLAVRNSDDGRRPTAIKLGVFPMTLAQSNWPVNTNDAYSATDWGVYSNKLIRSKGIAYITGEPAAPALSVRLRGLPDWLTTTWSASLVSERPDVRLDGIDDRLYSATNVLGEARLDIKDWMNEIIGGKVCLTSQVQNTSAATTEFYIRGKNPLDADARAYIDSTVDEEFRDYAWMIARHESRQGRRFYNQFNAGTNNTERPNWGAPFGFGICQIDKRTNGCVTAEVYNWKTNVVSMNEALLEKRERYEEVLGWYRAAYQNAPQAHWTEPDNVTTNVNGFILTARQWAIMTLYNGASGTHDLPVGPHRNWSTPIHFDPILGRWSLHTNVNNYAPVVINDRNVRGVE